MEENLLRKASVIFSMAQGSRLITNLDCDFNHFKNHKFFTSPFYYKNYHDNIIYLFIFPTFKIQSGPKVGIQYIV